MLVLDTNVLSELIRPQPEISVLSWINAQTPHDVFTNAVNEAELLVGIASLPAGRRRDVRRVFARFEPTQILGIVAANRATLVTRDVADFEGCGFDMVNPWSA